VRCKTWVLKGVVVSSDSYAKRSICSLAQENERLRREAEEVLKGGGGDASGESAQDHRLEALYHENKELVARVTKPKTLHPNPRIITAGRMN
jgi:hypothetical protein